jgi:uncharacterized membrane protein (DUF2068 family)
VALVQDGKSAAVKNPPRNRREAIAYSPRHKGHKKGLRAVAVLECVKGLLAIAASFVFLEIMHKNVDLEDAAQNLLYYLHIDPDRRLSQVFVEAAGKVMDVDVKLLITIAFVYAAGRLIESYGLWRQRVWAEWLAMISGAVYLPFELYKLVRKPTMVHWAILLVNVAVVVYIAWVRWDEVSARRAAARFAEDGD